MSTSEVTRLALEQPASIRRLLPDLDEKGWLLRDFVVGPENANLLHIFSEELLPSLSNQSPVVLYGEKSVGKSALAITLAVNWSRATNLRPLAFTTGKAFAAEYAAAVEIDDLATFRKRFRECRFLVLDELDPIADKPAAQQELAATLDTLREHPAPVVCTASCLPPSL